MQYKNVEISPVCGLKCDNPKCDWRDDSIEYEGLEKHINSRCPKCGQNVLTEKDYENAMVAKLTADFINTMSPEELADMAKRINIEDLKKDPMFSDAKGLEHLHGDGPVIMSLNTHNDITVAEIRPAGEQNPGSIN